jgi:RNA polymerase sigma factor (sigma-70 family)
MAGPPPPLRDRRLASAELAQVYALHAEAVRRHLRRFGASDQDRDDLVQEVFLVLHARRDALLEPAGIDPWLREVCRRVVAGHRRRAHRRHEIAFREPPETADHVVFEHAIEKSQQEALLHLALGQLDERSRDLVALHELGSLPLVNVAELVDADRKTVRKRLGTALRRLTTLLRSDSLASATHVASPSHATTRRDPQRSSDSFQVLIEHSTISVGVVGSVVVAVWPAAATVEALELLDAQFARVLELSGDGFAYLAVVEAHTRPPNLPARQKIVSMLQQHAEHIRVYATALQGGTAWLARPIMTGLSLLTRPPFPMQFFNGVPAAARWLSEQHPQLSNASAGEIIDCTERLRR